MNYSSQVARIPSCYVKLQFLEQRMEQDIELKNLSAT